MQFNRFSRSLCLVLTIWLTACGGGGSGGGNTPPANQVAAGKWDDGNGSSILVAPNGEAWATDFNHFPDKFVMYHGHVVMNGSAFSFSGDLFDAGTGAHGASPVSMTGTLTTKGTLTATATTKYGTQTYSLPYRATYDTTPNQADLWGRLGMGFGHDWAGTANTDAGGNFSGTGQLGPEAGCPITGTLVTDPSGKGLIRVSVTYGTSPCAWPGLTFTGAASKNADGSTWLGVVVSGDVGYAIAFSREP